MATQVKKIVQGPLTQFADLVPGVRFVGPEGEEFGKITIDEVKGVTQEVVDAIMAVPMLARLVVHAMSQKIGDSYAGAGEADSPLQFVREAIAESIKQIQEGDWRVTVAGGGRVSLLARALARATGRTVEEAQSVVDNLTASEDDTPEVKEQKKAKLKAIRGQQAIKTHTAAIKLEDQEKAKAKLKEQAAKESDGAELMGLFEADGLEDDAE